MKHYIVQIIFFISGSIALLAALFNWDWFFSTQSAHSILSHKSRKSTRWFYGIIGVIIMGAALFFYYKTKSVL